MHKIHTKDALYALNAGYTIYAISVIYAIYMWPMQHKRFVQSMESTQYKHVAPSIQSMASHESMQFTIYVQALHSMQPMQST